MRKTLLLILAILMIASSSAWAKETIAIGAGYGTMFGNSVSSHGPALDLYAESTPWGNSGLAAWASFTFPISLSTNGITVNRSQYGNLWGMELLFGGVHQFGFGNMPLYLSVGGGLHYSFLTYDVLGTGHSIGLGAMGRLSYEPIPGLSLSLGLRAAFIFLEVASAGGYTEAQGTAGASIYGAFGVGYSW